MEQGAGAFTRANFKMTAVGSGNYSTSAEATVATSKCLFNYKKFTGSTVQLTITRTLVIEGNKVSATATASTGYQISAFTRAGSSLTASIGEAHIRIAAYTPSASTIIALPFGCGGNIQ